MSANCEIQSEPSLLPRISFTLENDVTLNWIKVDQIMKLVVVSSILFSCVITAHEHSKFARKCHFRSVSLDIFNEKFDLQTLKGTCSNAKASITFAYFLFGCCKIQLTCKFVASFWAHMAIKIP